MNINQIPEPPIKPTPLPKIVKDQHKELHFTSGQTRQQVSNHNPNAQPTQGGFMHNLNKYLQAQQTQMQKAQNKRGAGYQAKVQNVMRNNRHRKKSNPAVAIVIVVIWIMFGVIGNISDEFDSGSSTTSDIDTSSLFSNDPIDPDSVVYTTYENSCYSIDLPDTSRFRESTLSDCEISFSEGYVFARDAFIRFNGEYFYEDIDDYFTNRTEGVTIEDTTINDFPVKVITDDGSQTADEYFFWIRDQNLTDTNGDIMESLSFYFFSPDDDAETQIMNTILNSIKIKGGPSQ